MSAIDIVIRYPATEADEEIALALARRLFARLDEAIDSLVLAPGEAEALIVHLNGQLAYDARAAGRGPRVADVLALLPNPAG
jgi:D-serine deaminase-like pyridoxal phosphate-dependent protein